MKTLKLLNYAADRWIAGDEGATPVPTRARVSGEPTMLDCTTSSPL